MREEQHVSDRRRIREQHHQAIDADTQATGWRHAELLRPEVVLVDPHGLYVAGVLGSGLGLEALALVDRVHQL